VARLTSIARRWVEQLLARYNAFGPTSLGDRRRSNGAPATVLTPEVLARVRERVKTPPDDGGVWTAPKVAAFMAAELGRQVAEQRGWEALRAIGWSIQRPRPRDVRVATPDEQAAFKKTSPRPSPRRRSAIPTR
jgi:transposase